MSNIISLCIDKKLVDAVDLRRIEGESRSRTWTRLVQASLKGDRK